MYSTVAVDAFKEEDDDRLETLSFYVPSTATNHHHHHHHHQQVRNGTAAVIRRKTQACKVCGKVLSSASSYYVHMKSHSDSKPFQCSQCEVSFCRKPYLEVSVLFY